MSDYIVRKEDYETITITKAELDAAREASKGKSLVQLLVEYVEKVEPRLYAQLERDMEHMFLPLTEHPRKLKKRLKKAMARKDGGG